MKRALSLFLSALLLFFAHPIPVLATEGTIHEQDAPVAEDVAVTAYAALVMDMDSGKVLYRYNAQNTYYPASTTKIMTALLCLKYGDIQDKVTVSSDAVDTLPVTASMGDYTVGEETTVYRLLQSMMVVSACDAANAIGEYIAGSQDAFVEMMNQEAENLGLENTHFANCHGLPNKNHYTTATDLAIITRAAMEYDIFREIVCSPKVTLAATNVHDETTITSTNGMLPGSYYPTYSYPYTIGVKTGYSSLSGYNLVTAANRDGVELIVVVMGCGTRETTYVQSAGLFDWAYENYDILTWEQDDTQTREVLNAAPKYVEQEGSIMDMEDMILLEDETEENSLPESPAPTVSPVPTTQASEIVSPSATPGTSSSGGSNALLYLFFGCGGACLMALVVVILLMVKSMKKRRRT